jgi:cytoskeletal protein RodZ
MEKKKVIIALIAILCVCIGIGTFQALNNNKSQNTTTASSTQNVVISTDAPTNSTTAKVATGKTTATTKSDASTKKATNVSTTKKAETATSESTTKASTTQMATTAKKVTTTKKATTTKKVTTTKKETSKTFSVSLTINCKNAVNYGANVPEYILKSESITVSEGETVFDALQKACKKNSISLKYQRSYVQGIGGLNEKDCGSASGWMYRVNGVSPNKPATNYELSSGDKIEWYYVTSPTDK